MDNEIFTVGVIVGTHGLKGEARVHSRTDFPHLRFVAGAELYLMCKDKPTKRLIVRSGRPHKNIYVVGFEGYTSVNDVEPLCGCELAVTRDQLPELPVGEYFIPDLIGCEVFTDEGNRLGVVTEVLTPGANDVYVVQTESGESVLLPATPECILEVDVVAKRMDVHIIPGLLD